jgi:hypothetical protein
MRITQKIHLTRLIEVINTFVYLNVCVLTAGGEASYVVHQSVVAQEMAAYYFHFRMLISLCVAGVLIEDYVNLAYLDE